MPALDFEKGFDAWVKSTDKKWGHDRSKTVGASEAFGCIRKVWFKKNDTPADADYEQSWGALRRGDVIENFFVAPAMEWFMENMTDDAILKWAGADQKTLMDPDAPLSATPDGLVIYADDDALANYGIPSLGAGDDPDSPHACFNLEIKSIDPRVNLREEKAIHRGQVQVQMGLTRKTTKWKPNYAVILYIDCSFFDDIEVFVVPYDQKTFEVAEARSRQAYDTKDAKELMAEGKIDGTCQYCEFKSACAAVNERAIPEKGTEASNSKGTPPKILQEFEALVRRERVASAAKKAVEAEHKTASEALKQWFRDTGVRTAQSLDGTIKASISWTKGRKSVDVAAMRADGLPVEDYEKQGDGHDRLSVSEKGKAIADDDE